MKHTPIKDKATWELRAMINALSMLPLLNTKAENKRLEEALSLIHISEPTRPY